MYAFKAELYKTLGHPIRLRILDLLRDGERSVSELQQALNIEPSSVSQQLAVLRSHHLVESRKSGTNVFYSVPDVLIFELLDIARSIFQHQVDSMNSVLRSQP
ncbi:helix-turn-helix transcriptional regulator [Sulfobacillus sp. hq2]|nr:metalloregulator ArsR/SmtB family transcription factor [Sulfobacillus sp. hq2]MCY0907908.1 metalloregulator ArsR/SmtB family transcription factor [Sulfobacillus thermotolerans]